MGKKEKDSQRESAVELAVGKGKEAEKEEVEEEEQEEEEYYKKGQDKTEKNQTTFYSIQTRGNIKKRRNVFNNIKVAIYKHNFQMFIINNMSWN